MELFFCRSSRPRLVSLSNKLEYSKFHQPKCALAVIGPRFTSSLSVLGLAWCLLIPYIQGNNIPRDIDDT